MAKRKMSRKNAARSSGLRKSRLAIAITVAVMFVVVAGLLAQVSSRRKGKGTSGQVSIASFASASPSKEYVYAGGRLVATEQPVDHFDSIGLYDSGGTFHLRNTNTSGGDDLSFGFGWGGPGLVPLAADWNGDGIDSIGLYDPASAAFFLRNSNTGGVADIAFTYGPAGLGWIPIVGDWDGDGIDSIGLYDPAHAAFFLRNSNSGGVADITFTYGPAGLGWIPIVGDWNGDGVDTVGLYDPQYSVFYLRNTNTGGVADLTFTYGVAGSGWKPITGNWAGL